jgi:SAM-dependent methyltransferase
MKPSDLDTVEQLLRHQRRIRGKPFLKKLYADFYRTIRTELAAAVSGPVVELGAGTGFFKEIVPQAFPADILPSPFVALCCDGQRLPLRDESLTAIVMLNVFHHLPAPGRFLKEAERCLKPGGKVVMIEPWVTVGSLTVYRLLHHERTDPRQRGWDFKSSGPLSGSNQALPWIVFKRDRALFAARFPSLVIERIALHTPLGYLFSGGLSHPGSLPSSWFAALRRLEKGLRPLYPLTAMFATITLARRGGGDRKAPGGAPGRKDTHGC